MTKLRKAMQALRKACIAEGLEVSPIYFGKDDGTDTWNFNAGMHLPNTVNISVKKLYSENWDGSVGGRSYMVELEVFNDTRCETIMSISPGNYSTHCWMYRREALDARLDDVLEHLAPTDDLLETILGALKQGPEE